jgi:hypothetical protein
MRSSNRHTVEFAAHAGRLLWVRPDRYVMARCTPENLPQTIRQIEQLLDRG